MCFYLEGLSNSFDVGLGLISISIIPFRMGGKNSKDVLIFPLEAPLSTI